MASRARHVGRAASHRARVCVSAGAAGARRAARRAPRRNRDRAGSGSMPYWLMKTEPGTFSVDDLAAAKGGTSAWDGVRNYQARNMLRDQMRLRDQAFIYHSSCDVPGVVGIAEIVREGYPDSTAFDRKHHHYDPDSDPKAP